MYLISFTAVQNALMNSKNFKSFVNLSHKLLQPSQTRWLSLSKVVDRLLDSFPALKLYFGKAATYDGIQSAVTIHTMLQNPCIKLYLEFLQFVLPIFHDMNREMQCEKPKIHLLYDRIKSLYLQLLSCYINKKYLDTTSETEIQYKDPKNYIPKDDIYLGGKVMASLMKENTYTKQEITEFKKSCLAFYVEAAHQIYKRFPFKTIKHLKNVSIITPSNVIRKETQSIIPLAVSFPNLTKDVDMTALDNEWRLLMCTDLPNKDSLEEFWRDIAGMKKGDDSVLFPLLSEFVKKLLILPHSSAAVERIFSAVSRIKTKDRNQLNTETVSGLLYTKRVLKNSSCFEFTATKKHFEKFDSKIYDS